MSYGQTVSSRLHQNAKRCPAGRFFSLSGRATGSARCNVAVACQSIGLEVQASSTIDLGTTNNTVEFRVVTSSMTSFESKTSTPYHQQQQQQRYQRGWCLLAATFGRTEGNRWIDWVARYYRGSIVLLRGTRISSFPHSLDLETTTPINLTV